MYPLIPSALNNFCVIGENNLPTFWINPKQDKIEVKKKKGSKVGSIAVDQSLMPDRHALILFLGSITNSIKIAIIIIEIIFFLFFNLIPLTKNFLCNIILIKR